MHIDDCMWLTVMHPMIMWKSSFTIPLMLDHNASILEPDMNNSRKETCRQQYTQDTISKTYYA